MVMFTCYPRRWSLIVPKCLAMVVNIHTPKGTHRGMDCLGLKEVM